MVNLRARIQAAIRPKGLTTNPSPSASLVSSARGPGDAIPDPLCLPSGPTRPDADRFTPRNAAEMFHSEYTQCYAIGVSRASEHNTPTPFDRRMKAEERRARHVKAEKERGSLRELKVYHEARRTPLCSPMASPVVSPARSPQALSPLALSPKALSPRASGLPPLSARGAGLASPRDRIGSGRVFFEFAEDSER